MEQFKRDMPKSIPKSIWRKWNVCKSRSKYFGGEEGLFKKIGISCWRKWFTIWNV